MKAITLTKEQYEALMQGQSITIEPPKPEKWEPKGGEWFVSALGGVHCYESADESTDESTYYPRLFGVEYSTQEAAEKARDAMSVHNRLLAWLAENDDGWVADWIDYTQGKWSVCYNYARDAWGTVQRGHAETPGEVYMSEANAEKLCKLLNEGIVDLQYRF